MALTRDDILAAALDILDRYGLADLTMRRVASQLGVQASALYWHVPNKQHLLIALTDQILAGLPAPAPDAGVAQVVDWGMNLRTLLLDHRSGAELVSAALAMRPWAESPGAVWADALTRSGLAADMARAMASAAQHLVLGHVLDEEQRLASAALKVGEPPDVGSADRLRAGLDLLVAGASC